MLASMPQPNTAAYEASTRAWRTLVSCMATRRTIRTKLPQFLQDTRYNILSPNPLLPQTQVRTGTMWKLHSLLLTALIQAMTMHACNLLSHKIQVKICWRAYLLPLPPPLPSIQTRPPLPSIQTRLPLPSIQTRPTREINCLLP